MATNTIGSEAQTVVAAKKDQNLIGFADTDPSITCGAAAAAATTSTFYKVYVFYQGLAILFPLEMDI
jgi:hypothetical protein